MRETPNFDIPRCDNAGIISAVDERITAAQVVIVLAWREQMVALTLATWAQLEASGCDDDLIRRLLRGGEPELQLLPRPHALDEAA